MARVAVIVPFPFDEAGLAKRREQIGHVKLGPDIEVDYWPTKAGPWSALGRHDEFLFELGIFEAGLSAAEEGYDVICVDTLSDSGVAELRSTLDIPVVSTGEGSFLYALMLGAKFSVLMQIDPRYPEYKVAIREYCRNTMKKFEVAQFCTSVEYFEAESDFEGLFTGREEQVFPIMRVASERAIEAGAHVIILGSTTLHQAGPYLSEHLPVPVVNPGPVALKLAETMLGLGHVQSRAAYPKTKVPRPKMIHSMLDAARSNQNADAS